MEERNIEPEWKCSTKVLLAEIGNLGTSLGETLPVPKLIRGIETPQISIRKEMYLINAELQQFLAVINELRRSVRSLGRRWSEKMLNCPQKPKGSSRMMKPNID